mgnify:CR=1 FL=1
MVDFKLNNLSFAFPDGKEVLKNINIEINQGEFVVICGKSGSGKTTLLRLLKPQLKPHGKQSGKIEIFEKDESELTLRDSASKIGFVMQNPELQCVTNTVRSELLFGLENLCYEPSSAKLRVAETAALFSLEKIIDKKVCELSGGQKQFLNLAAVMAMNPQVLILDEPTAQLDPVSAQRLIDALTMLCREYGVTVIITEHRLEKLIPLCERLIVLENGKIISDGKPGKTDAELLKTNDFLRLSVPLPMRVHAALSLPGNAPTDINGGRKMLLSLFKNGVPETPAEIKMTEKGETAVKIKNLFYSYDGKEYVLKKLSLKIQKGTFFALLGSNGAGKTTLLSLIGGLLKTKKGTIELFGKNINKYTSAELYRENVAVLPQNCEAIFAGPTVYEDLENILKNDKTPKAEVEKRIREVSKFCEITPLLSSHPYDISGGELERAALAAVLLKKPKILLLDEPTKGLDNLFKKQLSKKIRALCESGVTVVMVSHDAEFCAEYCDECALIFDGECVSKKNAHDFFAKNCFYTTAASRMTRGIFPSAVTESEVLELCKKSLMC